MFPLAPLGELGYQRNVMLIDDIKKRMFAAMKAGNTVEKEILRVAMGEITMGEARSEGGAFGDEDVRTILRKLIKSNREALEAAPTEDTKETLRQEIAVIEDFLPKSLTVDQIVAALAPVADGIRAAGGAGPAMGLAMKHLKSTGATAESKDVTAAVNQLRA